MSGELLTVLCGDSRRELKTLPAGLAHVCVTSPPYFGLRDYGVEGQIGREQTPEEYIANIVDVFREVRRVLRDDGTLWLNLGDSYANDGKWGGSSGGKHAKALHGNTGIGRGRRFTGLKPKNLIGIPWRVALALQADGWHLRSDIIEEVELYCPCGCGFVLEERIWRHSQDREIVWKKPNPQPDAVKDRPTKSHEYIFLLSKSPRYYYDADAIREPHTDASVVGGVYQRSGGVNRPDYAPETQAFNGGGVRMRDRQYNPNGRNRRTVWTVATAPYEGAHFATFPPELIKPCILAGSPLGGVVLDPFGGSGTTGKVAIELGRRAVLVELNPDYVPLIEERTATTAGLPF